MHFKSTKKAMASLNTDDNDGSNNNNNNKSNNTTNTSNNNNSSHNNTDDNNSNIKNNNMPSGDGGGDADEIRHKKQTLEHRKQELEKLLSEKSWLLQQIQKQETQILNGNYEYLNLNDILANLAAQYKHEQSLRNQQNNNSQANNTTTSDGIESSGILRRKTTASKENQMNNNNRQSEISNRSSEYDNYPGVGNHMANVETTNMNASTVAGGAPAQMQMKHSMKKRSTPTPITSNLGYMQLQQRQQQQQQAEQQMLQQHLQQYVAQQQQQQQQQQHVLLPHMHYHQQQQQQQPHQQRQYVTPQHHVPIDTISLYSVNSANVATLRQQHVAPQQQPIIVQCDKYYLSPTHQSYNDGGFIKSSQNIKRYVSPLASPNAPARQQSPQHMHYQQHVSHAHPQHPQHQQHQQQHQYVVHHTPTSTLSQHRHIDAISLAPSYVSLDAEAVHLHSLRWRSQSHIGGAGPQLSPAAVAAAAENNKSHSSDMLAVAGNHPTPHYYSNPPPPNLKPKPLDEISISSLNSETQKKCKPKQWLESSLDGPVMRAPAADSVSISTTTSTRLPPSQKHTNQGHAARERAKLSSQSMSSGRHYSLSSSSTQKPPLGANRTLTDDEGARRYAKLSQSTSQLHALEDPGNKSTISSPYVVEATPLDMPNFKYLPPKPLAGNSLMTPTPPPRPPPAIIVPEKPLPLSPAIVAAASAALTPDIRIESPKNMTVVQQATFQPYKEVTKPFEMSDFYKYSTKFRQKEPNHNTGGTLTPHVDTTTN